MNAYWIYILSAMLFTSMWVLWRASNKTATSLRHKATANVLYHPDLKKILDAKTHLHLNAK